MLMRHRTNWMMTQLLPYGVVGPSAKVVGRRPWSWREELIISFIVERSVRVCTRLSEVVEFGLDVFLSFLDSHQYQYVLVSPLV